MDIEISPEGVLSKVTVSGEELIPAGMAMAEAGQGEAAQELLNNGATYALMVGDIEYYGLPYGKGVAAAQTAVSLSPAGAEAMREGLQVVTYDLEQRLRQMPFFKRALSTDARIIRRERNTARAILGQLPEPTALES